MGRVSSSDELSDVMTSLRLPKKLDEEIKNWATRTGTTKAEIIRVLLENSFSMMSLAKDDDELPIPEEWQTLIAKRHGSRATKSRVDKMVALKRARQLRSWEELYSKIEAIEAALDKNNIEVQTVRPEGNPSPAKERRVSFSRVGDRKRSKLLISKKQYDHKLEIHED